MTDREQSSDGKIMKIRKVDEDRLGRGAFPVRPLFSRLGRSHINLVRSTELRRRERLLAVYSAGKQAWLLASSGCQRGDINMLTYGNKNVQVFSNRPLFYCHENKLSIII